MLYNASGDTVCIFWSLVHLPHFLSLSLLVLDSVRQQLEDNCRWIKEAAKHKMVWQDYVPHSHHYYNHDLPLQVVGSQARILYSNHEGRIRIALSFNKAISDGRLKVSIMKITSCGSVRVWVNVCVSVSMWVHVCVSVWVCEWVCVCVIHTVSPEALYNMFVWLHSKCKWNPKANRYALFTNTHMCFNVLIMSTHWVVDSLHRAHTHGLTHAHYLLSSLSSRGHQIIELVRAIMPSWRVENTSLRAYHLL